MGVQHRDDMRDRPAFGGGGIDDPAAGLGGRSPWGTWIVCAVLIVVWLLFATSYSERRGRPNEAGASVYRELLLHPADLFETGRFWQLGSCLLFHNPRGLTHIGWSLVLVFFFGRTVERAFGTSRFLRIVLVSGLIWSATATIVTLVALPVPSVVFGASGIVCALGAAAAAIHGRSFLLVLGKMVRKDLLAWGAVIVTIVIHPAVATAGPMIVTGMVIAHVAALAYGSLATLLARDKVPGTVPVRRTDRRAPKPDPGSTRARVDALLERIAADGLDSLSDEERAFLEKASKGYQ